MAGACDGETEFDADVAWYDRNRSALVERYRDRYVAIVDGEVIDHDVDFDALAARVFAALGPRSVFMPRVTNRTGVLRILSPRLRG